jgi:RNA polymerase sigma factor (sigma-70 family)
VSGADALLGYAAYEAWRPIPIFRHGGIGFGSFYVGEADSVSPAHLARLVRSVMRKGRSQEDAEDLVQEAVLRRYVYAKGNAIANDEAFLRHAVHNLAIDQYRRDRFRHNQEVPIENVDREKPLISLAPTPDQILDSQQRLDQLTRNLDAVSLRTREVYLAHQSGYSYAEIAADMGIAKITIKRHIARAHMALISMMDRNGNAPTEKRRHPDVRAKKGFNSRPPGS